MRVRVGAKNRLPLCRCGLSKDTSTHAVARLIEAKLLRRKPLMNDSSAENKQPRRTLARTKMERGI